MIFEQDNIFLNKQFVNKEEVLLFLANQVVKKNLAHDSDVVLNGYLERENESTTGFGFGVAIPHAKLSSIKKPAVFFIRNQNALEWQSLDNQPVKTIISIVVPTESADKHLKLLAKLSRNLIHPEFLEMLKNGDEQIIWQKISEIVNGDEEK